MNTPPEVKRCRRCKEVKPTTAEYFKADNACRDGTRNVCLVCLAKQNKEWHERNAEHVVAYRRRRYDLIGAAQRGKQHEKYQRMLERMANGDESAIAEHQAKVDAATRSWFKRRYDMTPEEYFRMAAEQNNLCAICGVEPKKLTIDHDHKTTKVRALLCYRCNQLLRGLEAGEEWMRRATEYLKRWS